MNKPHVYKTLRHVIELSMFWAEEHPFHKQVALKMLEKRIRGNTPRAITKDKQWHSSAISASVFALESAQSSSTLVAFRQGSLSTCPDVDGNPFHFMTNK